MASPRYSIVIPTRDRARTLRCALQTCLELDYDDYEVVVCDNCGSPEVKRVVDEADSPKVVYVRSDKPLAMSCNWELAVSRARGEFVTVLGDDDGMMPYALRELDALYARREFQLCRWDKGIYLWPCFSKPEDANLLTLPLVRRVDVVDGRSSIQTVIDSPGEFASLPMIYTAVVRRDLLDQLRRRTGRVFPTAYPDVYSGFALAYLSGEHLSTSVPMSLCGTSGKSTGAAYVVDNKRGPVAEEFERLNRSGRLLHHPWAPDLSGVPNAVADSFWHAKANLFPNDRGLHADRRKVATAIVRSIPDVDPADRAASIELLRRTLADDPRLLAWFDAQPDPGPPPPFAAKPKCFGFDGRLLHFHSDRFGVRDVLDAVRFSANVLFPHGTHIRYDQPGPRPRRQGFKIVGREIRRLMRQGSRLLGLAKADSLGAIH